MVLEGDSSGVAADEAGTPGFAPRRAGGGRPHASRALLAGVLLFSMLLAHLASGSPVSEQAGELPALLPASLRPAEDLRPGAREALLDAYAPAVLLAPGEDALPTHVEWYLARSRLERPSAGGIVEASVGEAGPARLRLSPRARGGSPDPGDWTVYGHVYRAADGGILIQYWFFYAYNSFHGLGDHEADWEHVTVRISRRGRPLGAWYSQHDANAPGNWSAWNDLSREGAHPVVLAAFGSHASYARRADVRWFDDACPTLEVERAAAGGCRVWRTWSGTTGGVVDLGSRRAPAVSYLLWPGRWGADGGVGDRDGGPPGPAYQPGWCSGGTPSCS